MLRSARETDQSRRRRLRTIHKVRFLFLEIISKFGIVHFWLRVTILARLACVAHLSEGSRVLELN